MLTPHTWTSNMDTLTQLVFYVDTCSITCLLKWSVDMYIVDKLQSSAYSGHKKVTSTVIIRFKTTYTAT